MGSKCTLFWIKVGKLLLSDLFRLICIIAVYLYSMWKSTQTETKQLFTSCEDGHEDFIEMFAHTDTQKPLILVHTTFTKKLYTYTQFYQERLLFSYSSTHLALHSHSTVEPPSRRSGWYHPHRSFLTESGPKGNSKPTHKLVWMCQNCAHVSSDRRCVVVLSILV